MICLQDVTGVLQRPREVMLGAVLQYTIMPALGLLISRVAGLPPPFAIGCVGHHEPLHLVNIPSGLELTPLLSYKLYLVPFLLPQDLHSGMLPGGHCQQRGGISGEC